LERHRYSERPPRDEYVPTARGRDFRPVLIALLAWGNKHFAPEGASVQLVDTQTGATVDPIIVDAATGRPIQAPEYAFAPGPAAPERTRRRYASIEWQNARAAEPSVPAKAERAACQRSNACATQPSTEASPLPSAPATRCRPPP